MAIDILITTNRISTDPVGRNFIEHLRKNSAELSLNSAALYYDFPSYADYETVAHKPDALLVSPDHGILAIRFINQGDEIYIDAFDESLVQFCSTLIGRLLKSKALREGLSTLIFPVLPVLYNSIHGISLDNAESEVVSSLKGFEDLLASQKRKPISNDALAETRSVIEGAKALTRPKARNIRNPKVERIASALSKLEMDIANFDQKQRRAALINVDGPQRIRGLAGSGKTVILAMKAAHLHLNQPDAKILVTFYTRSLYSALKTLITRFFRNFKDEDPDWSKIHIRHGWGGNSRAGTYADAARMHGIVPLTFMDAQKGAQYQLQQSGGRDRADPFDYACRDLLSRTAIRPIYDHILIDEGQDFPSGFYELCFSLAVGERDKKNIVWAYDELQNILDVKMRTPDELFGKDVDGEPRVSLTRAANSLPAGADNDEVLNKCYRNQREILVIAHALGFGIYGNNIVQMLESREHWEDVGYKVLTEGPLSVGKVVEIERPAENSPLSIEDSSIPELITTHVAESFEDEISWVANQARSFLSGGLQPEDIIIISLDDKAARSYFRRLSSSLAEAGIETNNITADPYNEPPFSIPGKITLSTVYRAKGNEASVVFAVGVDAVSINSRSGRNKLFTAFTRTKAWLRVSGMVDVAATICGEIREAQKNFPKIVFTMPDIKKVNTIQRDLNQRSIKAKEIREEYLKRLKQEGFDIDEAADLLSLEDSDEQ